MNVVSLYLCCMLMACAAFAQRNYVPGTIITLQNDSLKGFIDFRNWYKSPTEITFKESLSNTTEQHFKPADINGFKVSEPELFYVSRKLSIEITPHDINNVNRMITPMVQDTPVFLRVIVTGKYNLYEYGDVYSRAHFIYDGKDVPAKELEYIMRYLQRPTGGTIYTGEQYKEQLADLFADNPAIAAKAKKAGYYEKDIRNLFVAYDQYKDPGSATQPVVTVQNRKRQPVSFGIMAGAAFTNYNFTGSTTIAHADYKSSTGALAGAWLEVPFGRVARNLSLEGELLYKRLKTSGKLTNYYGGDFLEFDFSYLQLNTLIRYTYPTKTPIRPYANVGLGNGIMIKKTKNTLFDPEYNETRSAIDKPRTYEQTLVGGIGVKIYKVNAEVRYTTGNGFSPFVGGGTGINSFQILAAYSF